MRCKYTVLAGFFALSACTQPPPTQPTAAELAQPQTVLIGEDRREIRIDANTSMFAPNVAATVAAGGLIGLAVVGVIYAAQVPSVAARTSNRVRLAAAVGDTSQAALLFSTSFRRTLRQSLADLPGMRIDEAGKVSDPNALRGGPGLVVVHDAVFTADAMMLVARASVMHVTGEGSARRVSARRFLVFSSPVDAASAADAVTVWAANDGRLLREQAPLMAEELATLIRTVALSEEAPDYDRLPETTIQTPGLNVGLASDGPEIRLPERAPVRVVRQENGRALVIARVGAGGALWTWISLPGTALESNRRS